MASNTATITFAGDSTSLERAMDRAGQGAKDMAKDFEQAEDKAKRFGRSSEQMADGLDGTSSGLTGVNDLVMGFSDVTGIALPPQAAMIMGFADMAGGLATLTPIMAKAKGAMQGVNAVMRANPLLTVITLIGLLVAGFVIAYKKGETFRNIVNGALGGVRKAFQWLGDKAQAVWDALGDGARTAGKVIGKAAEIITTPYRLAFNGIASLWNNTVGRLSFSIPSWVPGIGGAGFDVPDIPTFANGGILPGGLALVGERGPELIAGGRGSQVFTNSQTRQMLSGGKQEITIRVQGDQWFRQMLREAQIRGGKLA